MQDPGYGLPRTPLPGTSVNKSKKSGVDVSAGVGGRINSIERRGLARACVTGLWAQSPCPHRPLIEPRYDESAMNLAAAAYNVPTQTPNFREHAL